MKLETTFIHLYFHQVAVIDSCASTTAVWEHDDKNNEEFLPIIIIHIIIINGIIIIC